jgi:serine phosphatase RsbU (regulator of sigma subunit)
MFRRFRTRLLGWIPDRRSARFQLTLIIWAVLIPAFIISNAIIYAEAASIVTATTKRQLINETRYLSLMTERWGTNIRNLMTILASNQGIRTLDATLAQELLSINTHLRPTRQWRLFDRDLRLVAHSGNFTDPTRLSADDRADLRLTLEQGAQTFSINQSEALRAGSECLTSTEPVYDPGVNFQQRSGARPIGVLSLCIDIDRLGEDSGLNTMDSITDTFSPVGTTNTLRADQGDYSGTAFMVLTERGHLLFPTEVTPEGKPGRVSLGTPEQIRSGPWGPFIRLAVLHHHDNDVQTLTVKGRKFFLISNLEDDLWTTIRVVDEESVFRRFHGVIGKLYVLEVIILILVALAIHFLGGKLVSPLRIASRKLESISEGDFEQPIIHRRHDEIGHLFDDINQTALRLKQLVAKESALAVTKRQLETARAIQKSFLVEQLPSSEHLEIAASFHPAYEIGADWYDALKIDDISYVVIADVCDKGVGSALFMSVFRTLLRYSLLQLSTERQSQDGIDLSSVMSLVNDYMATTHGSSTMFATVFLAAYKPAARTLSYVTAGHESPLILRSHALTTLDVTGPAIGIFEGASFQTRHVSFCEGDLLFAYTDGLTDARSPQDAPWGIGSLRDLLLSLDRAGLSPSTAVDRVNAAVELHIAGADQFDDLTVLSIKAVGRADDEGPAA